MTRNQPKMRDLMPEKYGPILRERTGKSLNHIYDVVNNERTEKGIWTEVLKLADEHQKQLKQNRIKTLAIKSNAA
ncbi:hypothetical protein [Pontibacter burrus]|uniref:Uncharacterized protein n=1 Tax=Pontibacter burrus TaxID=2704466 RepID=A0A6B3LHY2_9BACT|nr:hypothetical protein [Pontibacter burrus]NEM96199.1 hypothetical protein [Pontibacter burrus]